MAYTTLNNFTEKRSGEIKFRNTIISNSPIDHKREVFVLFQESGKLSSMPIDHFSGMLTNQKYDYKLMDLDFMGDDTKAFGTQLLNDLENLHNIGLKFVGAFLKQNKLTEFSLIMYQQPESNKQYLFDLELKILEGMLYPKSFEKYLNEMYQTDKLMFRSILPIYSIDRTSGSKVKRKVSMNLVVFQKMSVNHPGYKEDFIFYVKNVPIFKPQKVDPDVALMTFIENQKTQENMDLIGMITNTSMKDSLMVF